MEWNKVIGEVVCVVRNRFERVGLLNFFGGLMILLLVLCIKIGVIRFGVCFVGF